MIIYNKKSRRLFLKSTGKLMLGLPFLPSLVPKAFAQTNPNVPVRFVAFCSRWGTHYNNWQRMNGVMPNQSIGPGAWEMPLANMPNGIVNPILGNNYQSLYSKLTFLRGLDSASNIGRHNLSLPLTATIAGNGSLQASGTPDSIDVILSRAMYTEEPKLRVFRMSPPMRHEVPSPSWCYENSRSLSADTDPRSAFQKLFEGTTGSNTEFEQQKARDSLLVDKILEQINSTRNSRRISSEDKTTFENVFDRLRDIQVRWQNRTFIGCSDPNIANYQNANFEQMYQYINHTLISAFQCDLTRIGVISINAQSPASNNSWHTNTHHQSYGSDLRKEAGHRRVNQFITSIVMHLIDEMNSITEANGRTMLDNSVVLWSNELASGNHPTQNMPVFIGGSAQGKIRNGVLLDYQQRPARFVESGNNVGGDGHYIGNYFYNNLLMDIMRACGASPQQWERLGAGTGYGNYDYAERNRNSYSVALGQNVNHSLPGFLAS